MKIHQRVISQYLIIARLEFNGENMKCQEKSTIWILLAYSLNHNRHYHVDVERELSLVPELKV